MKQNYALFLVGILTVGNAALSMEDVPQTVQDFRTAFARAESLKKEADTLKEEGNEAEAKVKENDALIEYGKAADIEIPKGGWLRDIYPTERANQKKAISAIETSVEWGTDEEKLAAYKKYAPTHFDPEIKNLEKNIAAKESDETLKAQEDVFNKANEAAGEGKYTRAKQIVQNYIATNPSATLKTKAQALLADIEKQEAAPAKLLITSLQKLTNGLTQVKNKISKPA